MKTHTIHAALFSAATALNTFWILNIAKETYPVVKAFLNFYPVTGPLLGLYGASTVVLIAAFAITRSGRFGSAFARFSEWYFMFSTVLFFFAVFPPVYEPVVEWLSSL